jgi:Na+-transporting NADH:ubiquinone oxidoreductase subunit A
VLVFGDRLLKISVKELSGAKAVPEEEAEEKYSLAPKLVPERQRHKRQVITLNRGHDIHIKGKATQKVDKLDSSTYAVKPVSFPGMSPIPKLTISEGDEVKAGDPVLYDRKRPDIMYTAPVSGEFVKLKRGDKRKILEVVFLADKELKYKDFGKANPNELDQETNKNGMLESRTWPLLKQHPYGIVPAPGDEPKMIYISCFNTAPLAPDHDFMLRGKEQEFQAGVDALHKLTSGGVHLGLNNRKEHEPVFMDATNVTRHWFEGPHPAGNPGVQIHHINPIRKGDVVWTITPQDVVILGRLFTEGRYNAEKMVALCGSEVKKPQYFSTIQGASIENMVKENLTDEHVRYISGDVLTGSKIHSTGHLGFFDEMATVIREGDEEELFGWLMPSYPRPSVSPTFLSYFFQGEELEVNTNQHGEERPFVVTGLYEQLLPMDIYPMELLKAIIVEDFEKMEGLGIYEIIEEDLALCEFACPSKTRMQSIVRQGLDTVREG